MPGRPCQVVETALDKSHAEQEHKMAADEFAKAHLEYNELWKKLQKFYEKAKPYYVECSSCNEILRVRVCHVTFGCVM